MALYVVYMVHNLTVSRHKRLFVNRPSVIEIPANTTSALPNDCNFEEDISYIGTELNVGTDDPTH